MTGTVVWGVLRGIMTLGLATAFATRANSRFEAAAFAAALIAYHRLAWATSGLFNVSVKHNVRSELWFQRLDRRLEGGGVELPTILRDLPLEVALANDTGFEQLQDEVNQAEKTRAAHHWIWGVTEVLLILALLLLLALD